MSFDGVLSFLWFHSLVGVGGVVEQAALFGKSGAVTGTVPRMLGSVIFERTAKVWATRSSRRKDADQRLENIDKKLRSQHTSAR